MNLARSMLKNGSKTLEARLKVNFVSFSFRDFWKKWISKTYSWNTFEAFLHLRSAHFQYPIFLLIDFMSFPSSCSKSKPSPILWCFHCQTQTYLLSCNFNWSLQLTCWELSWQGRLQTIPNSIIIIIWGSHLMYIYLYIYTFCHLLYRTWTTPMSLPWLLFIRSLMFKAHPSDISSLGRVGHTAPLSL